MQTTTSRIGAEGMFVRSLVCPKEGSKLSLSLSLPGAARPVDATGIVAPRPEGSGKDQGFWVQFDRLSDDARVFLDVVLRSRGVAGPGQPVRKESKLRAVRTAWRSVRDLQAIRQRVRAGRYQRENASST